MGQGTPPGRGAARAGDRSSHAVAAPPPPVPPRWRILAPPVTLLIALIALPVLLLADAWCLRATRLPVRLDVAANHIVVTADGQTLTAVFGGAPDAVLFVAAAPAVREYQVDGTDSTNNFTEDAADLTTLLPAPAYQFEAWMRGDATYSTWVDVRIASPGGQPSSHQVAVPSDSRPVALPPSRMVTVTVALQRPEAPASIEVLASGQPLATVSLDRNDRTLQITGTATAPIVGYFPIQPWPFAAEVADTFLRVAIWAWAALALALGLALLGARLASLAGARGTQALRARAQMVTARATQWRTAWISDPRRGPDQCATQAWLRRATHLFAHPWQFAWRRTSWQDRMSAITLAAAFGFTLYIALAQYHGEPHILDASAYLFQAKIFASGRLAAPVPLDLPAFQGPFMVAYQGRWFAQYPPATSALLALGLLARMPWLVEPLLGTAALAGIYVLGRRLFGGPTALLAVALGTLSPFFAYLTASYLSHTVALCCEVYFLLFAVRYMERFRQRDIVLAGACLGVMFCTRELSAVICGITMTGWMLGWQWRALWRDRRSVVPAALAGLTALGVGVTVYLAYNFAQTGNALILPRNLFSTADRYGFGPGIGFYGQHTLAAGLVILDQLLTSLLIDLYGWPFYLTLIFIPLALLRRDHAVRWDWFLLTLAALLTLAQVGYFYHGIFLGPRYLYETLPCVLLLTARGITALPHLLVGLAAQCRTWWSRVRRERPAPAELAPTEIRGHLHRAAWVSTALLVAALVAFNLGFYLPRQLALHQDFTGLPPSVPVDVAAVYRDAPHNALVVTSNWMVYAYVLWPLNDPLLRGDTLYAFAPGPSDIARLMGEFPSRAVYILALGPLGQVSYLHVASPAR